MRRRGQGCFVYAADVHCGPIVRCRGCGLVYSCPREIFAYDSERQHSGYRSQIPGKRAAFEYRLGILGKRKTSGRLLEVGAHHGIFLDVARNHGWQVLGIEPDPQCCE
ncbi:MAG: methyltransferase domain-containing protein, partial [Verrucomicrobiia bacterium]